MGFICAICSESVEKIPSGVPDDQKRSRSNLSAGPCGHIFHSYCINKWMSSNVPSSNLCPNCRKCIPKASIVELYPDSYDDHSNPTSPSPEEKAKSEQFDRDIASLKSKLHRVEADFKIQLSLYELLTQDHQDRIAHFNEQKRLKDIEIATLKSDSAVSKQQFELEVQKLKTELQLTHQKLETEKNGRIEDRKKQVDFCEKMCAQLQTQRMEVLVHSLQFQRDAPFQKPDEDLKPGPSRFCKPFKSRPSIINCKPKRGKKMVYEKGQDSDEIEELHLEDTEDDDDIDIMACLDPRPSKRKLPRLRPTNPDISKPKLIKRLPPADLSLSPITLTLSSDSEDEKGLSAAVLASNTSNTSVIETIPGLGQPMPPMEVELIRMDISEV